MIHRDDDAYEWHETTTLEDKARGRRMFVRGRPKDEAQRLRDEISSLIQETISLPKDLLIKDEVLEKLRRILG